MAKTILVVEDDKIVSRLIGEHIERMGGTPRALQSVVGAHPMTTLVAVTFEDLDAYGACADKTATAVSPSGSGSS